MLYLLIICLLFPWNDYAIGTLTQTGIGLGWVTYSSKRPMRGQYIFLMAKRSNMYGRFILRLLFPQSSSYFHKMSMLISLIGTLAQARIGVGSVIPYDIHVIL